MYVYVGKRRQGRKLQNSSQDGRFIGGKLTFHHSTVLLTLRAPLSKFNLTAHYGWFPSKAAFSYFLEACLSNRFLWNSHPVIVWHIRKHRQKTIILLLKECQPIIVYRMGMFWSNMSWLNRSSSSTRESICIQWRWCDEFLALHPASPSRWPLVRPLGDWQASAPPLPSQ